MKIVLFDIDGTLVRAGQASKRAIDTAFSTVFGVAPSFAGVEFHGSTDPLITQALVRRTLEREITPAEGAALTRLYLAHLGAEIAQESNYEVLPGVPELVRTLAEREDIMLGLQTGNIEGAVPHKLGRAGLHGAFTFGGYGSDSAHREVIVHTAIERAVHRAGRRHARPEHVIVIGDTPRDVAAGRAWGATTIAVATGIYPLADLAATGATIATPTLTEAEVQRALLA
jgi:beta-phosphoglucomutase-like phosphatase (HAD superfamily)